MTSADYRMAAHAARHITSGTNAFIGIGLPSLVAIAAKRGSAPHATLIYESGVVGASPRRAPLSTGSSEVATGAEMISDSLSIFAWLQRGGIDLGLLSAAQVDVRGNLNSSLITPDEGRGKYLVGSGGAHDIAALAAETLVVVPHDPRRIVDRVDFRTSSVDTDVAAMTIVTSDIELRVDPEGPRVVAVREDRPVDEVLHELGLRTRIDVPSDIGVIRDPDPGLVALLADFLGETHVD